MSRIECCLTQKWFKIKILFFPLLPFPSNDFQVICCQKIVLNFILEPLCYDSLSLSLSLTLSLSLSLPLSHSLSLSLPPELTPIETIPEMQTRKIVIRLTRNQTFFFIILSENYFSIRFIHFTRILM